MGFRDRPLHEYESTRELVSSMCSAIKVHRDVHCSSGSLHSSISPWNILISQDGGGTLVDTDLINWRTMLPDRNERITPFASIHGLRKFNHKYVLADDLESFFWVLVFAATRRCAFIDGLDDTDLQTLARAFNFTSYHMDSAKLQLLEDNKGKFIGEMMCCHPLGDLIEKLRLAVAEVYLGPFDEEDFKIVMKLFHQNSAGGYQRLVYELLEKKSKLHTHDYFVQEFEQALKRDDWYNLPLTASAVMWVPKMPSRDRPNRQPHMP